MERLLGESDEDLNARSSGPPLEEIRTVAEAAARRMLQDEELARLVSTLPIRHEALLKPEEATTPFVFRRIHALVEHGVEDGQVRTDVDIEVLCAHVHSALETAMRAWAEGRTADPVTRLRVLLDLAFEGIAAPLPPSGEG